MGLEIGDLVKFRLSVRGWMDQTFRAMNQEAAVKLETESILESRSGEHWNLSKTWAAVALAPSVLAFMLFWSLAIHMHHALVGWPSGIGNAELHGPLLFHAEIVSSFYGKLLPFSVYVMPFFCVIAAIIPSWRKALIYAAIYFGGLLMAFALMFTAPSGFQYWWWD